jgi:hypothetical protein
MTEEQKRLLAFVQAMLEYGIREKAFVRFIQFMTEANFHADSTSREFNDRLRELQIRVVVKDGRCSIPPKKDGTVCEVVIRVTLQVDSDGALTKEASESAAQQAVNRALKFAENSGFEHDHAETTVVCVADVAIEEH